MANVTMKQLLEAGVHFGHQTKRWNPKMKPYIFGAKNGIHIIDLQKSVKYIEESCEKCKAIVENGGKVLFVGTKKQAQDAIETEAQRCGMPFVNHRWLGGMLTNYKTIKQRVRFFRQLEEMETNGEMEKLSKKDAIKTRKQKEKMSDVFRGIKDMDDVPHAVFVVDIKKEKNAVAEAQKLGIPVFALIDTNCDPDEADYLIPGNDDAIRSISLISRVMADAVLDGLQGSLEGRDVNEDEAVEEKPRTRKAKAEAPVQAETEAEVEAEDVPAQEAPAEDAPEEEAAEPADETKDEE
ncbi:MAG TPA: 30S ribosomal protein S2 [Candidatus Mcinerneyibacteriales bacterium]|nr:30S ribosomal protein S2 [Candidatus Mcinerneyibacteriales bacterium]